MPGQVQHNAHRAVCLACELHANSAKWTELVCFGMLKDWEAVYRVQN